ncbi:hypothetical protein [Clostridium sp.]|uniref:hypothetical protein n=1 Tax=Clostridium sp. TaxID=1506 RepID=UPI00261B1290|nr:hypothetical protein [Clostridium sp.]
MGYISQNITNISNSGERTTVINGVEYPWVKGMKGNSLTMINNKIYIDGYELKNGQWKRTLMALFYRLF